MVGCRCVVVGSLGGLLLLYPCSRSIRMLVMGILCLVGNGNEVIKVVNGNSRLNGNFRVTLFDVFTRHKFVSRQSQDAHHAS